MASTPFRLRIVGAGADHSIAALSSHAEVDFVGEVASVGAEYAAADAAIVPVLAGGGTRIKVIEAFAHQRPVVSTSMGAEGIEAQPERDLLLGDDPEAFAAACLRLMQDEALRQRLTLSALALVTRDYSQDSVNRLVASLP
jgi:glycosyltransferase involved in cell wall biosynthesis